MYRHVFYVPSLYRAQEQALMMEIWNLNLTIEVGEPLQWGAHAWHPK